MQAGPGCCSILSDIAFICLSYILFFFLPSNPLGDILPIVKGIYLSISLVFLILSTYSRGEEGVSESECGGGEGGGGGGVDGLVVPVVVTLIYPSIFRRFFSGWGQVVL